MLKVATAPSLFGNEFQAAAPT